MPGSLGSGVTVLYVWSDIGKPNVSNVTIWHRVAMYYGAGIYNKDDTLTITNSTISGNTLGDSGGFYVDYLGERGWDSAGYVTLQGMRGQ